MLLQSDNNPVIYVAMKNMLYGCLKSVLLFHKNLDGDLEYHRLKINLYDPSMVNK